MSAEPVGTLAEAIDASRWSACEDGCYEGFACQNCIRMAVLSWLSAKGAEDAVVEKVAEAICEATPVPMVPARVIFRVAIAAFIESVTE